MEDLFDWKARLDPRNQAACPPVPEDSPRMLLDVCEGFAGSRLTKIVVVFTAIFKERGGLFLVLRPQRTNSVLQTLAGVWKGIVFPMLAR